MLAGPLGYLVFADSRMDLLGDSGRHSLTEQEIAEEYRRPWTIESRFGLQFLGTETHIDSGPMVGNGVLGLIMGQSDFRIGSDCLDGSAYDTTPSEIRGRASGDISAVASIAVNESEISIHPAGSNADPLRFEIADTGRLVPLDDATSDTLKAYGC